VYAVMMLATVASAGPSVAYQIDPAHTGSQSDGPTPPLTQRWSRDMGGPISYPLIVGGKVFVTVRNKTPTDGYIGTSIYALDAATGATSWGPINLSGTYPWSNLAYENGRVFALTYDGILRAFDATSGALLWQTKLANAPTEAWAFTSAPTALNGLVYTGGSRYGGTVFAVSEQDGSIKWTAFNPYNADFSSPAVSAEGVYVSYTCHQYDYAPATGNLIWHHALPCHGGGGATAVLYGNHLYARNDVQANFALDANRGEEINGFGADLPPAFSGSTGYYYQNISTLQARDAVTSALKWSFQGDGTLNTAPIVVNGYVYVGSHSGQLYALDKNTGTVVWTGTLGSAIAYTSDFSVAQPIPGLGAAEGIIVVPAENLLVAYESGGAIPTPTPTPTPGENPIDQTQYLVHQHYLDFLNREPDQIGFDFWVNQITSCGTDNLCREVRRINVSAAFYLSIEFQETGYFVERVYKAAYGDATAESTLGGVHQLKVPIVRLNEFLPDVQQLGWGVVVGPGPWQYQLDQNKNNFTYQFDHRARFVKEHPFTLTPTEFANRLFANAGITPTPAELAAVIGEFSFQGDSGDPFARGRALRDVAENPRFIQQENNRAFVLMQYFGYLQRNPNDLPDADYTGYDFWLSKLDQFHGNYIQAEMVKAFISSDEYRKRFGQ
jgi:outer membrane protein assembly factor BamB